MSGAIAETPPRFPLIVGPTAGGKTGLAVRTALALESIAGVRGEVVSADAFLVYRGMDVGTAKPTADERRGVTHHLIDLREPGEAYSVRAWLHDAERTIAAIRGRGAVPIVVGGTHLYAKALLDGLFDGPDPDPALRAELEAMGLPAIREELERVDPASAARIHPNDLRRSVRAVEVYRQTGTPMSEHATQWDREPRKDVVLVGLDWPIESINRRINARVRAMVAEGLVEEARALWEAGKLTGQAADALGYKQLVMHFEGRATLEVAIEAIKVQTRRFAKNQRTWLRRLRTTPGSIWLTPDEIEQDETAGRIADACAVSGGES